MADLETTIALVFEGVDRTGGVISGIGSNLKQIENSVGSVTGPMASLAGSVLKTEAAIVTLAAAMAGVAVNEAGKFNNAVTETGTLFNGTNEQVKGLGDEILDYARNSTASIDQINAAVYKAISTGTDYAESVRLVGAAEVLATGGRADLAATTDLLTASLNAYGAGTQEAADYSDTLFAAVQAGNTNLPELAANLGKVTGIAAAAGVPFSDLNAAVSALTISAGNTAESTILLKSVLTELISPSASLETALGGLTLKGDGLEAVMERLKIATGGDATAMAELFGSVRAVQGALVLANDSSGKFSDALDKQAQRTGIAQAANEALTQSYESTNQNLINNIRTTVIMFGSEMLGTYGDIAKGLGDIFKGAGDGIEGGAFDDVFDALDGLGEKATATLEGIAKALPEALGNLDFSGLLSAFGDLGEELSGLFGDLDLTKADDLETALQFIVDGIESLTRVSAGIVDGLQPFILLLGDLITEINNGERDTKALVGELLGLATGVNALLPALGGLGSVLATVGGGLAVIGGAKSAGAAITGLAGVAAALAGPLGLAGAAVLAGAGIGKLMASVHELVAGGADAREVTDQMRQSMLAQIEASNAAARAKGLVTEADRALIESEQKLAGVVNRDSNLSFDQQVAVVEKNTQIKEKLDAINNKVAVSESEVSKEVIAASKSLDLLTDAERQHLTFQEKIILATQRYAEQNGYVVDSTGKLRIATGELAAKQESAARAAELQTKAQQKQQLELEKSAKAAQAFELELDKLASNERIRALELNFDFDLEELKSQTDIAKTIIEGMGVSIQSTGDLLGDLFGTLGSGDLSRMQEIDLGRQVDLENDRRDEALKQQAQLVAEQTGLLREQARLAEARATAVNKGSQLIKVEAEGLTPALAIIFDEILKFAQVRASQEGAEFLVGL